MGRDRRFAGSRQGKGHGRPRKGANGAGRGREFMARYDTGTSPGAVSIAWGHRRPMDGGGQSFLIGKHDIREFSINSLHSRISHSRVPAAGTLLAPKMIKHSGPGVPPACIRGYRGGSSSGGQGGGVCACGPPPEWGKMFAIFGPDAEGLAKDPALRGDRDGARGTLQVK